jgi:hypothetical protein
MRRAWLGLGVALTAAIAYGGCSSGKASATGTGGATTSTTVATVTVGSGGGSTGGNGTCIGDGPDGICQFNQGETCACVDCATTALCVPDTCQDEMTCDQMLDSCTCAVCAEDSVCGDPNMANCNDDGVCDSFFEGCHCKDCWTDALCAPSVAACNGGVPDGVCDYQHGETCDCVDCQGTPLCAVCVNDGMCQVDEPCNCPDCVGDPGCNAPQHCSDDGGVCAILVENCSCEVCQSWPQCQPDGGAPDGGGGGGAGGAGSAADGG